MVKMTIKQTGVTLVEVVVTMFIMAVGLLGLAGMQSTSVKDGLDVAKRSQVTWLVTELIERIRSNPAALNSYPGTIDIEACGAAPAACSETTTATASDCTAAQIATYDVWEVFCGQAAPANVIANSPDSLNLASVTIDCGGGICNNRSDFTINISWVSNVVGNSQLLSTAQIAAQENQSIVMRMRP